MPCHALNIVKSAVWSWEESPSRTSHLQITQNAEVLDLLRELRFILLTVPWTLHSVVYNSQCLGGQGPARVICIAAWTPQVGWAPSCPVAKNYEISARSFILLFHSYIINHGSNTKIWKNWITVMTQENISLSPFEAMFSLVFWVLSDLKKLKRKELMAL